MMTSSSQQEDRFLQAREARQAARRDRRSVATNDSEHNNINNDDNTFSLLRNTLLADWRRRLEEEVATQPHVTASQRNALSQRMDAMLQELQELRRNHHTNNLIVELPLADVRALHEEFTALLARLEEVREQVCPPTKFVFAKYRAAMMLQQQQREQQQELQQQRLAAVVEQDGGGGEATTEKKDTGERRQDVPRQRPKDMRQAGKSIERYQNVTITVETDGAIRVVSKEEVSREETIIASHVDGGESVSSLLLQDLDHCDVTLHGVYKALHLQRLCHCTVRVVHAMEGAMHVTACIDLTLHASCHQLRLHESQQLHCHVWVGSGPILEDCQGIVFHYTTPTSSSNDQRRNDSSDNNMVRDAKDFNWLRSGIPSPNFCIVEEEEKGSDVASSLSSKEMQITEESRQSRGDDKLASYLPGCTEIERTDATYESDDEL